MPQPADGKAASRWYSLGDLVVFMVAMVALLALVFTAPDILASEHPVRSYVLIAGVVTQVAGLTMAAAGLYRTWRANAPAADDRAESREVPRSVVGIPLAVTGLGVTILGVLLQAAAWGLPS